MLRGRCREHDRQFGSAECSTTVRVPRRSAGRSRLPQVESAQPKPQLPRTAILESDARPRVGGSGRIPSLFTRLCARALPKIRSPRVRRERAASEATDQGIARPGDEFQQLLLPGPLEGDQAPDAEVGIAAHRVRVEADRRRDADLEPCETARTAEIACRLLKTGDAACCLVDIERESVPARRMAERAPEGLGRVAADDDRRMGQLRGPRPRLDAAKREEPSMVLRLVLRPDREHRLEVLDRPLPLVGERDAERVELGLQEPDPEAEDEAPAGDDVDARELLRQHQWIALRQDDDPGTELQALGVRRDRSEEHTSELQSLAYLVC